MFSADYIKDLQREAALKAARANTHPAPLWPEDLADDAAFAAYCRGIPFIGDHVPAGWEDTPIPDHFPDYPYRWFFVDASGFGRPGEPALTLGELREKLEVVTAREGFRFGLAITEVGQVQAHIGLFQQEGV